MPKLFNKVLIPFDAEKVKIEFSDTDRTLSISSGVNVINMSLHDALIVVIDSSEIVLSVLQSHNRRFLGMAVSKIKNAIKGLSDPWCSVLEMKGVGYRAYVENSNRLVLSLGFSHPVHYLLPPCISVSVEGGTVISLKSFDKVFLGNVVADLSLIRKRDVYKGKGVFIRGRFYNSKEMCKK